MLAPSRPSAASSGTSSRGKTTALHDAPFSFDDPRIDDLQNVTVKNGDVLTTSCYPMGAIRCGLAL